MMVKKHFWCCNVKMCFSLLLQLAILEENCLLQLKLERTEEQLVGWKNQVSVKDYELSKLACESVTYFNENEVSWDMIVTYCDRQRMWNM